FHTEPKICETAKSFVKQIQDSKIANEILEIWLFGSYARGNYKPDSDIDILIVSKKRNLDTTNGIDEISEKAMESVDYEELLAIMEIPQEEWLTMKKDHYPLAQSIEQEGILLWKNQ
ncbi:MAG: nucleotidyltransferase domain-containing protein, partial [Deltaproteobacteria bacterium]|nr:nucleotidyltransferase domain-containing protein [Deltaproteobacteria bacterium]